MPNLEQEGHDSYQQNQAASDLLHLSPATHATRFSIKGIGTSSGIMASIWKRPCPVLHITKTTAVQMVLNSSDSICVLVREQGAPLTIQAADQFAWWSHMSES